MMPLLEYFFNKPMQHAVLWSTAVFVVFYFLTRTRRSLSLAIYIWILIEMVFVSLHFTARLNNIVILKDTSFQVINFSLFLLWLAHLFNKDTFRFQATPMNIPVFIFFWACVLGSYWSPRIFWYYGVEWASRYAASVLLFYLIVNFITTRTRWNVALYTFLAMMVITSIYAIMQVRGYDFMSWGRIVNVSTFGNKDFAASFWTYSAPIPLFLAIGARNWFDRVLYLGMASLGFYNMWTGETRGAWVGMMALIPVIFAFESQFGRMRIWLGGWKKQAVFWSVILVVVLLVTPFFMSEHRVETFKSIFQFESGTNIIRVYMWWTGARMLWDEPLLGQGLGASHVTYPFFRPDRYHRIGMSHNTDYVHSEELQFLCEQGILGYSAWMAMLVVFFYICYKKLKTIDDLSERYTLFSLAGAFLAAVVHDSMNVNLRWTSSMIAFWYVLALGTRYVVGFEEPEVRKQVLRESRRRINLPTWDSRTYAIAPLVIAGFAFMVYGQYRVLRGDWALKATEESGGQTAIQKGADTLKHNPYSHSAYYKVAFHHLNENTNEGLERALQKYHELLMIAPNYAQTHQNTGLIHYRKYANTGQKKYLYQAVLEFEWATTLENNMENHTKLLQLYTQLLNDSSRGRYHNQFLFWNSLEDFTFSWVRYWYSYAVTIGKGGSVEEAQGRNDTYRDWIAPLMDAGRDYWLYRTDTVRRIGRPRDEVRYAMKMAARYVPHNQGLLQYAVGSLLAPSTDREGDILYLANIVENLDARDAGYEFMMQVRNTLAQQVGGGAIPPLMAYTMGLVSYKAQDMDAARNYFQIAQAGQERYQIIRDGLKKYKI